MSETRMVNIAPPEIFRAAISSNHGTSEFRPLRLVPIARDRIPVRRRRPRDFWRCISARYFPDLTRIPVRIGDAQNVLHPLGSARQHHEVARYFVDHLTAQYLVNRRGRRINSEGDTRLEGRPPKRAQ